MWMLMTCSSVGSSRFAFSLVWCSWTTHASAAATIINEWLRYTELNTAVLCLCCLCFSVLMVEYWTCNCEVVGWCQLWSIARNFEHTTLLNYCVLRQTELPSFSIWVEGLVWLTSDMSDGHRRFTCIWYGTVNWILLFWCVVSKAQQLLQGLQSKDEAQQVAAVTEMCQVFQVSLLLRIIVILRVSGWSLLSIKLQFLLFLQQYNWWWWWV